jgi:serine protease Do
VKSRNILWISVVALIGAIIGSFSMMLFASSHFPGIAGPGNTPPAVSAAALPVSGTDDQARIVSAVNRVEPSVVALEVVVKGTQIVPIDPLSKLFGQGEGPVTRQPVQERASGSGFIYSRDGLIVTNAHVVPKGTSKITVVFANGDHVPGHLYSSNPAVDLALVKVDHYPKLPPPVQFADSSHLQRGEWSIAIGEPFALQQSVSVGVVSGFERDEPIQNDNGQVELFKGLLQTSAPINPGNSGGPLIDYNGRVIGINQSTASPEGGAQGIGFAIPANTVVQTAATLEKNRGKTLGGNGTGTGKPFLGVGLENLNSSVRTQTGYQGEGVAVAQVVGNSPADKAGIQPGAVIEAVNGKNINSASQLQQAIAADKPGTTVTLRVWYQGVKQNVRVTLGEEPVEQYLQQQEQSGGGP